ncbi:hypothetical protein JCM3770_001945 [Rhodotorula araucariae]
MFTGADSGSPPGSLRRSSRSTTATATLPVRLTKRGRSPTSSAKCRTRASKEGEGKSNFSSLKADEDEGIQEMKPKQRRKGSYAHLGSTPLTDRIKDGLDVLFCGENPGVKTAELQLHYASPHNHFYKCLHAANLTSTVLPPTASRSFPEDLNIGITNLASELNKDELEVAVPVLLRKITIYQPKLVAFVGMKVCETVLRYFAPTAPLPALNTPTGKGRKLRRPAQAKAQIGPQSFAISHPPPSLGGERRMTYFYCLPSTSGRVAAYPLPVKLKIWAAFGEEVAKLRVSPPEQLSVPLDLVVHPSEALELPEPLAKEADESGGAVVKLEGEATHPLRVNEAQVSTEAGIEPKVEVKNESWAVSEETMASDAPFAKGP